FQKLPRVSGKRFHITSLPLGIDGVEGQRRFAGAGHTRNDRQLIVGDRQGNIFQVMDPRTADPDELLHRYFQYSRSGYSATLCAAGAVSNRTPEPRQPSAPPSIFFTFRPSRAMRTAARSAPLQCTPLQ